MDQSSCFQLGYVAKLHGLKGDVKAVIESDNPGRYQNMESVFVEQDNKLVPFFIEQIRLSGQYFIIKFEESNSPEESEFLIGTKLWLPLEFLPELSEKEFYFHDIIEFSAEDLNFGPLGKIVNYYSAGAQDLLSIDHNGKEILIPVTQEFIHKIDKKNRVIIFNLPDGLIELYLEP